MISLSPQLTSEVPNPNIAYCNAWIPIANDVNRPLFAQASYITNASDISLSLSANDINVNLSDVENLVASSNTLLNVLTANTDEIKVKVNTAVSLLSSQLGQSGFDFIVGGQTANSGPYSTVQVVSTCKISDLSAANSTVSTLTAFELPVNFSFNGPISLVTLEYGAAFVYKL